MKYATIKKYDIANGLGVRVSLFVSGCNHRCEGCFNKEAWDFNYGNNFTEETEKELLDSLSFDYIKGISILGGEPFENVNALALIEFIKKIKKTYPKKDVWIYSGFIFEEIIKDKIKRNLLDLIDVLVDGKFMKELYSPALSFRGSSNQRIINVKESLKLNKIIIYKI